MVESFAPYVNYKHLRRELNKASFDDQQTYYPQPYYKIPHGRNNFETRLKIAGLENLPASGEIIEFFRNLLEFLV